ncbi:MAG: hypothetical protein QHH13_10465, partial [Melioribacter sp.]|nr:hypothetical protein [Melioribacter sp.]
MISNIILQLLKYEYNYKINSSLDYAIFYSDKIKKGLKPNTKNTEERFILGYGKLNLIRDYHLYDLIPGESGSPVININGEVEGLVGDGFR